MDQFRSVRILARLFLFTVTGNIFFNAATAQPVISSFSPSSGSVGTSVTITGTGFNITAANNTVYFGAAKAIVSAATATSLTLQVPSGATNESITVTTGNLTGYSSKPFHITFGGGMLSPSSFPRSDFNGGLSSDEMVLCDFDLDGKNDIVNTGITDKLYSIRNTSTSSTTSFAAPTEIALTGNFVDIAAGDLDGDGKQDIVLADPFTNNLVILRNTSIPGTIGFTSVLTPAVTTDPRYLSIADTDGDGRPDIIVLTMNNGSGGRRFSIFRNTTTGGTVSFAAAVNLPDISNPGIVEFAATDLDGDLKPDLAVTYGSASPAAFVRTYKNTSIPGTISFAAGVDFSLGGYSMATSVTAADIDGDDKPELVVTDFDVINILRNTSTAGTIAFAAVIKRNLTGTDDWSSSEAYVTDMNGDGKKDLLFADVYGDIVGILENNGSTGNISFGTVIELTVFADPLNVIAADMNGDGKPDIITSNLSTTKGISVYTNAVTVLPLRLLSFSGVQKESKVFLQWSTAAESNTLHFVIEHSTNGNEFSSAEIVKAGAANNEYSLLHGQPASGWNYYRLKIVDADGKFTYSHIIRVHMGEPAIRLQVYPNPSNDFSVLEHPAAKNGSIILSDMSGKMIRKINAQPYAGQTIISAKDLIAGTYTLTWISEGWRSTTVLVVR